MAKKKYIIEYADPILITGANGFIGNRVVKVFAENGFTDIDCAVRPSSNIESLLKLRADFPNTTINLIRGNLLSKQFCRDAVKRAKVIVHLAAGRGGKSYSTSYLNMVVTTNNLLESLISNSPLMRFLNVSSFTVYSNRGPKSGALLDESSEIESNPLRRGEPYCYSKIHQEKRIHYFADKYDLPFVNVRPGAVYGPGNLALTGRIGIDTFGFFMHLGGSNTIPLSYVDNCAYAIFKCSLIPGIEGEDFNIVDDDLPASSEFLNLYKRRVKNFKSVYIPKFMSYLLCFAWEKYSRLSRNQLPPVFNRYRWHANWKGTTYTNHKLKERTNWHQIIPSRQGYEYYFDFCRNQMKKDI